VANTWGVVADLPAVFRSRLFIDAAVCGTVDAAPVTPFVGVVTGTPDGVIAGSCPLVVVAFGFVVLVIGDEFGFTIGVEFGFGIGVVVIGVPFAFVVEVALALGLTIGLEVGLGFGLEFGFGVGLLVTGVPLFADGLVVLVVDVAAAGFVEEEEFVLEEELEFAAA
jgi:hypothetical protein